VYWKASRHQGRHEEDKEAYQRELGLEQERIRHGRTLDVLKESEKREALEKGGKANLFTLTQEDDNRQ
jgi:hypothetical protein